MSGTGRPIVFYLAGLCLVGVAAAGVMRIATAQTAMEASDAEHRKAAVVAGPRVSVARATRAETERRLELQGEARPYASVTVYAKLSGYLRRIFVDRGDRVRKNQVLAVIESPELDRQYDAAAADAHYKRSNARRSAGLAAPGVVSAREAELDASQAAVSEAQVASLRMQKSYETIRAPIAGIVTARFADPGALMQNAANAQTSALPLVTVATVDRLRVFVYVDQRDAAFVRVGDPAELRLPDRPATSVAAKVTRLSQQLDARTRTMLVEVEVDNREPKTGALRFVPGSFVTVALRVQLPPALEVPAEALVVRGQKHFVALVSDDGHVHYQPVTVASDDGARVRLKDGLAEGQRVALNLGDGVLDGSRVQVLLGPDDAHAKKP